MTDWETIAHNRLRLFWLGLGLGVIAGVFTGLAMAAPPVWIDDLQTSSQPVFTGKT